MAVEPRRGCGWRKIGGLYLMGGNAGIACCKLPILLHTCPTCNQGVKQSRGWQWIDPRPWLGGECSSRPTQAFSNPANPLYCPAANPEQLGDKVGLLWIGTQFYPTAEHFLREANSMGISRRIQAVPRGFKLGEHWVFLAHPKAIIGDGDPKPGIFRIFKPSAIEKLVTQTQSEDAEEMEKLHKAGVTPIIVPDDDKDHQGSVYDDARNEPTLQLAAAAS